MNYEQDYSHSHCWQEKTPPCGLPGKHRCCLCKKPIPAQSIGEQINNSDAKKWLDLTYNQMQDNIAHKLNPPPAANWKDEKIADYDTKFKGLKETAAQHILHAVAIKWVSTALQEANTKGVEEALAKVEEWVKENKLDNVWVHTPQTGLICRECRGQEDCECAPYNEALDDLLHHLQQLKDNKTV